MLPKKETKFTLINKNASFNPRVQGYKNDYLQKVEDQLKSLDRQIEDLENINKF